MVWHGKLNAKCKATGNESDVSDDPMKLATPYLNHDENTESTRSAQRCLNRDDHSVHARSYRKPRAQTME